MQEPTTTKDENSAALTEVRRKLQLVSALALMTFAIVNLVVVLRNRK